MPDTTLETISATQSAALFDLSKYTTRWLLWRVFSGLDDLEALDEEENERMFWGKVHEPAIFKETLRRLDLEGRYNANQDYIRHPELPIGCTPDGEVWHPSKGRAVVQVKCTDWLNWKENWTEELPPPHIVCQVQHEMLVRDAQWAVIPCLINGNELRLYEALPDVEFQQELITRVNEFFRMVKDKEEPDPLGVEIEVPQLLKRERDPKKVIDLTESEEAYNYIQQLRVYEPQASQAAKAVKEAKAKLLALAGDAGIIKAHGYGCEITFNPTKESAVELPDAVKLGLTSALKSGMCDEDDAEAIDTALHWRKVTRKAGVTRKYRTWEEETQGAAPWIEGFDTEVLGA